MNLPVSPPSAPSRSGRGQTWLSCSLLVALGLIIAIGQTGCQRQSTRGRSGRSTTGSARRAQSEVLLAGVGEILNELPERVDLNLAPAQPLLTAQTSSDGREVLATITVNPASPESGINYLRLATSNANFRALGVRPQDMVRLYYVSSDQETADRGLEERSSIELTVRRIDSADPENSLILMGSLNGEVTVPERIEIWRYSDKRMEEISADMTRYERIRVPPVGWEPSADRGALQQLVERANQWLRSLPEEQAPWQPAALLESLPAEVRSAKGVAEPLTPENLTDGQFAEYEGRMLQQAVWMRDIAAWARGGALTDADTAAALLDWTVRNIQLDTPAAARTVHFPWQAVMYGHGSAEHRGWVFVELCRQRGIPAVMVSFAPSADAEPARILPASLVGDDLLLFDPEYGLPLPGADGPATLTEVQSHPELLRKFDLPDAPYPLNAENTKYATVQIVATPLQLSRRAWLLEDALEGTQIVTLAADVDALQQRLAKLPGVDAVTLWPGAFDGLASSNTTTPKTRTAEVMQFTPLAQLPELWQARTLHFQGFKDVPRELRDDTLAEPKDGHRDAVGLYQHKRVRASDALLQVLDPAKQQVYGASKQAASYWLGLLSYDRGNLTAANNWLNQRSFAAYPDGIWLEGGRYNFARTLHRLADGDPESTIAAIELLQSTPRAAPSWAGNQVLARQWAAALQGDSAEDGPGDEPPEENPAAAAEGDGTEDADESAAEDSAAPAAESAQTE